MSYVRKLGASALVIAAAFAVAFAVLISSSPPAEAVVEDTADGNSGSQTVSKNNGDTVYIRFDNDGFATFEISTTGAASASFTHGDASEDGQSITCNSAATDVTGTCDTNPGDGDVTVALKIDDDSGKGNIFIKQTAITGAGTATTDAITVTVKQVPTTLTAKLVSTSINSGQGADQTAGRTLLDIRLTDADGAGIAGESITVVSTRALLSRPSTATVENGGDGADSRMRTVSGEQTTLPDFSSEDTATLAGTVDTSEDGNTDANVDTRGYARVAVQGGGSAGVSTITLTVGDLVQSVDVVLHGPVKTISAEAAEGAIQVGGSTFIVVTALDSGGNPVKDQVISLKGKGGITAPDRLAKKVDVSTTANKDPKITADATTNVVSVDKGDIPSCGAQLPVNADATATPPVAGNFASTGTNGDGQCVIQVTAAPAPNGAARGTHTVVLVAGATGTSLKGVDEVSVEIQVGGPAVAIESDAPERIDSSDEVTINVTVLDDEGVRVGVVAIEVDQTAGDGKIITETADNTKDGRAKFTYLAPSTPGLAEFLVRTRDAKGAVTAKLPIIINIGAEEVAPEPEAPSLSVQRTTSGTALATFSGGSIDELAAALTAACGENSRAWALESDGDWVSFSPSAPIPALNAAFNALYSGGLDADTPLVVTDCTS